MVELIETFVSYMENLERCICIVYDASSRDTGSLGLKAIRLTDAFVETFRQGADGGGGVLCLQPVACGVATAAALAPLRSQHGRCAPQLHQIPSLQPQAH